MLCLICGMLQAWEGWRLESLPTTYIPSSTDTQGAAINKSAAAAAKSLQSCPTLCDPIDSSPPGSPIPGIFPGRSIGVGCHCLLHKHVYDCLKQSLEVAGRERRPQKRNRGQSSCRLSPSLADLCLRGAFLISLYMTPPQIRASIPNPETQF